MGRKRKMPSCRTIADANRDLTDSLHINPLEADKTCWRCKFEYKTGNPERAHVQAASQAGSDSPRNIWLLCARCHSEQPDNAPPDYQEKWLRTPPQANEAELSATDSVSVHFTEMTNGISMEALFEKLMDEHGTDGMVIRIRHAMKNAKQDSAGSRRTNGIANAVYNLVTLWETT